MIPMECIACGRSLSNDPDAQNAACWTASAEGVERSPYCADSVDCATDAGDLLSQRTCVRCGRTPAAGYASVWTQETGTLWLCHGDDDEDPMAEAEPSCYERAYFTRSLPVALDEVATT